VWRDDPQNATARRLAIKNAQSVLVIGGGATGVEAAGYLAEFQVPKGVKVGICHSGDKLLPTIQGAHNHVHPYL